MEKKFIVPAVFFMAPVLIWIAVFIILATGSAPEGLPSWADTALFAVLGLMVLFSGFRCLKAGGPRMGNIVRASVLAVLCGLTWWKAGIMGGIALLISVLALVCLAVFGKYETGE